MTNRESKFIRNLYFRNHRLCALYIALRNIVKWPLEVVLVLPLAIVYEIVTEVAKCIWGILGTTGYTIYSEALLFGRDWRAVFKAFMEKPEESEAAK